MTAIAAVFLGNMKTIRIVFVAFAVVVVIWKSLADAQKNAAYWDSRRELDRAIERQQQRIDMIRSFPPMELTPDELGGIPRAEELPEGWLATCGIGSMFVCRKSELAPDMTVVGEVVKGDDLLCGQWGASLCVPERGINRFRVEIFEPV